MSQKEETKVEDVVTSKNRVDEQKDNSVDASGQSFILYEKLVGICNTKLVKQYNFLKHSIVCYFLLVSLQFILCLYCACVVRF